MRLKVSSELFSRRVSRFSLCAVLCFTVTQSPGQQAASPHGELSIVDVIKKLSERGYSVGYSPQLLRRAPHILLRVPMDAPAEQLLQDCFSGLNFNYSIKGRDILIFRSGDTLSSIYTNLRGRVLNGERQPLGGATVTNIGSTATVITNAEGYFSLPVRAFSTKVCISYIGYGTQLQLLSNRNSSDVTLLPAPAGLDEARIQGYGLTTPRLSTGSVFRVKGADIAEEPEGSLLSTLEARAPGLFIRQLNGVPGSAYLTSLGGRHSIEEGNEPLYMLDGVPLATNGFLTPVGRGTAQGDFGASALNFIPTDAIASVELLKDASAIAVYGSRASNGVILITLKPAKDHILHLSAEINAGVGHVVKTSSLLSTQQFLELRKEGTQFDSMAVNSMTVPELGWDTTRQSNFKRETMGGAAFIANAGISVTGGCAHTYFLAMAHDYRETGVFPGSASDERRSLYLQVHSQPLERKLHVNFSGLYTWEGNHLPIQDYSLYQYLAPNAPAFYNATGDAQWGQPPLSFLNIPATGHNSYAGDVYTLFGHLQITYQLSEHVSFEQNLGYNGILTNERAVEMVAGQDPNGIPPPVGSVSTGNDHYSSVITESIARWKGEAGPGMLTGLLGVDWQGQRLETSSLFAGDYPSDLLLNAGRGAGQVIPSQNDVFYRYAALFGRMDYNVANKYLLTASWRRDGSSRFGPGNQYGNFWALGGGWIFRESAADEHALLSFGKIRGSYGTSGNDQIGDYQYFELYNTLPMNRGYQGQQGIAPVTLANNNFRWELNYRAEVALELGLWKNRIMASAAVFRSWSGNQLVDATLAPSAGLPGILSNLPIDVRNEGLEFLVQTNGIQIGKVTWTSSLALTLPRNVLVSWPGLALSNYAATFVQGRSLTVTNAYHLTGVDPQSGLYTFRTRHSNGIPDVSDEAPTAGLDPSAYAGWSHHLRIGNWELDLLFDYRRQRGVNPLVVLDRQNPPGMQQALQLSNGPVEWMGRWRTPGDRVSQQRAFSSPFSPAYTTLSEYLRSDASSIDASYMRLKCISLSYHWPKAWVQKMGLNECKMYIRGQDLWTITRFPVTDPETQDPTVLPPLRVLVAGLQVNF